VPAGANRSTGAGTTGRGRPGNPGPTVSPAGTPGAQKAGSGRAKPQAAPPSTLPIGESASGAGLISPSGLWEGGALDVGTILSVPAALAGLAVVFFVLQWLIDRRDPKFVDAPLREDDDSVGFD